MAPGHISDGGYFSCDYSKIFRFNIVVLIFLKFGLSSSVFLKRFSPRLVWFSIPINICCKISLVQLYVPAMGTAKD